MIRKEFAPLLFSATLSGLMSLIVSAVSTLRVLGLDPGFASAWLGAWIVAWVIAFPTVAIVAPLARAIVERLTVRS